MGVNVCVCLCQDSTFMQRQMWKGCRQREWAILDEEKARELQESQRSLDSVIQSATKEWRQKYLKLVIANQGWKRRQEALKLKPKRDIMQSVRQQQEKDRLAKKGSKSKKSKCESDRPPASGVYRVALLALGARVEPPLNPPACCLAVCPSQGSFTPSAHSNGRYTSFAFFCESVAPPDAASRHEMCVCVCVCE